MSPYIFWGAVAFIVGGGLWLIWDYTDVQQRARDELKALQGEEEL